MEEMYVKWPKQKDIKNPDEWEIEMSLNVDPEFWGPRKLRRFELEWNEEEGKFTEVCKNNFTVYRSMYYPPYKMFGQLIPTIDNSILTSLLKYLTNYILYCI